MIILRHFLKKSIRSSSWGTVNPGPGTLRFFGSNAIQNDDFTVMTDANDKLESLSDFPLTSPRRKQSDDVLNKIENS